MILFIFYFTVAFFLVWAIWAFFDKQYARKVVAPPRGEVENLKFRKEELLAAISDLEYDFEMKKITEADYLQLKENLTREAVEVLKQLEGFSAGAQKESRKISS